MAEFSSSSSPHSRSVAQAGDLVARRYRLARQVAQGGMAQVWEAQDEILTRAVAIKILLPHLAADRLFVTRFRQEALAAARLSHPNIVSVYDTCSDDLQAIVMELIEGRTLRTAIDDEGSLDPGVAIDVAIQVCEGLSHAHQQGLVHRDIKPGNILLDETGRVLITDFGIAKAETNEDLTEISQVVGTAKYLSPEQAEGGYVDARSDLYSVGIVLYEMLSGKPPFVGESKTATALARLIQDPVPLSHLINGVTPVLDALVLRCLARHPDDRFQSAVELLEALEDVAVDFDDHVTRLQPKTDQDQTVFVAQHPPAVQRMPSRPANSKSSISRPTKTLMGIIAATTLLVGVAFATTEAGQSLIDRLASRFGVRVGPLEALAIMNVSSYDPFGSQGEHDDELDRIIDDNPQTGWTTERYRRPDISGLKQGVGIVLSLGQAMRIETIALDSPTVGWRASFYVANEIAPELSGWGEAIATQEGLSGNVSVDLKGRSGSHVLVWITHLGDGRNGPRYSMQVNEARLLG